MRSVYSPLGAYRMLGVHPDQYWLGRNDTLVTLRARLDEYFEMRLEDQKALRAQHTEAMARRLGSDDDDEDKGIEQFEFMRRVDHVAVMEVSGSLTTKPTFWSWLTGSADYQSIRSAAVMAALDPDIAAMVMDIDSPGGAVSGCALCANVITAIDRNEMPVLSTTASQATSAAYWLGVSARTMTASPDAEVGSIGAIALHMDYTKALTKAGLKPTVFRSGKYKALGSPVEKLTPLATTELQNKINHIGANFGRYVATRRGLDYEANVESIFNGKEFFGAQALELGLIDGHTSGEDLVARLNEQADAQLGSPGGGQVTHSGA